MHTKKNNDKNKILVTGGAGMIGSNLVKKLVKDGLKFFICRQSLERKKGIFIF